MKNKYRVVFLGTPEFAKESLNAINNSSHEVVGVITVADKPAGRGNKIIHSPVKQYALENNLFLLQPEKLKNKQFLSELELLNADIFVVVAFRMLPQIVWQMPKLGTFNLHASLLPQYRGAAPINYALLNGDKITGNTTFFLKEQVDTGDVLLQEQVPISDDDNFGTLHDKLMFSGAKLVVKTLDDLWDNSLIPRPQPIINDLIYAKKIFKEDCEIDWKDNLLNIHNKIRAFSPYPTAWTTIKINNQDLQMKIFSSNIEYSKSNLAVNQLIIEKKYMYFSHPEGKLYLTEVQIEGKRKMLIKDFLNGIKGDIVLKF